MSDITLFEAMKTIDEILTEKTHYTSDGTPIRGTAARIANANIQQDINKGAKCSFK